MTHTEIVRRIRDIADREPTYITHELLRLAREIEESATAGVPAPERKIPADEMEALVRATQPARRPSLLGALLRGRR
ncbi:hypothetical protein [Nonomuraea sp. NPDC023979]|uniref:hypothetical protein n=1 Tax=Nonomuraea sp. NPDC023979 TaxID=3154796 RepID=UPI0033D5062F